MLSGPNLAAVNELALETKKEVIASGGVSQLADLAALKEYEKNGVRGAIVGKALYEGKFSVIEALREVQN